MFSLDELVGLFDGTVPLPLPIIWDDVIIMECLSRLITGTVPEADSLADVEIDGRNLLLRPSISTSARPCWRNLR